MSDKTSVLVAIGDERKLTYLCDQLAADGYEAVAAGTAHEACVRARLSPPAALLLGELAERHEQLRLLRAIRAGGEEASGVDPYVGVIVLENDPGELAELRALEAGADDCVAREISYPLLRARLRSLLARLGRAGRAPRRVAALVVEPQKRTVTYAGERVALSRLEFALLERLASDPERVFTKRELLREVWGYVCEGRTRTLDAHACRLRAKLVAVGAVGLVVSVRGVGYRLTDRAVTAVAAQPNPAIAQNGDAA